MHKSLKDVLRACRLDLKRHLSKREKWVREWPGQVSMVCTPLYSYCLLGFGEDIRTTQHSAWETLVNTCNCVCNCAVVLYMHLHVQCTYMYIYITFPLISQYLTVCFTSTCTMYIVLTCMYMYAVVVMFCR